MVNIIARYEDHLIHVKNASANTVSSYMRDLRQYASYLETRGISVLDADQSVVSEYALWLHDAGKSPATISRSLASLKSLYLFAMAEDEIEVNPVHNIKVEKARKSSCCSISRSRMISKAAATRQCSRYCMRRASA